MIHLFSIFNDFIASFCCYCYFGAAVEKFHFTFFADSWGALLIERKIQFCVFFLFSALIYFYLVEQKKNLHWEFILFLVWLTFTLYGNIFFYIILSSYRLQILLWKHQKYSFTISYISLEMSHNLWYACHFSLLFRNHKIWNDIEICLLTIEKYFNSNAWYERKKNVWACNFLGIHFQFPFPNTWVICDSHVWIKCLG